MELLERELPLKQLEEHLRLAAAGQGRVVFLAGEAGVGKTTLANVFCQHAADQATFLKISCDALSTPGPLGPLRDLAPALDVHPDRYPGDRDGRDRLFRDVLGSLARDRNPTVVVAEDAHWADGATLELLRFLSRRLGEQRVLFIVTYRDDELGPDHPLRLLLGDLATATAVSRMRLFPLSEDAVRQLAEDGSRDPSVLYRLTGGNPFFLAEVLASDDGSVPATVGDAVLARASRLPPEARAVLDLAAVIGTEIAPELLWRVTGPALDAVDACIARGLLQGTGDAIAFRHAVARDAILATMAPPRRRLLHAQVLAALRDMPEATHDFALLAHHAEAAGERDAVLAFATAAAEQAGARFSHREAAAQYARALRFASSLPAAERAELFAKRAMACYFNDQGEAAIEARLAALDIWRSLGEKLNEGETLRWLSHLYWLAGRGAEAETAARAALEVLEAHSPGPELAMAYSNFAQLRMLAHDLDGTMRWGERAIALSETLDETEILIHALANVGSARLYAGDERGAEDLTRSLELALDNGFVDHAIRALNNLAWMTLLSMRLDDADKRFAAAIEYAIAHDLDTYHWYLLAGQATLRVRQGTWDAAESVMRRLLQQPMLAPMTRILALTSLGQVLARRGSPGATQLLDEALVLALRTGQLFPLGSVRGARAEAALLKGDLFQAKAETLAMRDQVFTHGNPWLRGEFAWLLRQVGERPESVGRIAEPYALQIAGAVAGAVAAWREIGCPYEEACAQAESDDPAHLRQALATFERMGAGPAMARATRRLRELGVRDLPAVKRGPRASTRTSPAGLTQRETEVLVLLTEGLRNAEIADRLYLSPKTIRNHLSVIFAKLGVNTRTEATRAAVRLGIIPL